MVTDTEVQLENTCDKMADVVVPIHRYLAPDCYNNMALFGDYGCRVGKNEEKPYSGATCVVDFCAHSHRDDSNMIGGCTAIITLTIKTNIYHESK